MTGPLGNIVLYSNLTGIVSLTAPASVYLNVLVEFTTAPAFPTTNQSFSAVRIA
jgi:hypothetical protein